MFVIQVVAVHVEPSIFDSYYNGCCNGTFWPLFHSMPDRATFIAEHWRAYSAVNEEFAAKTVGSRMEYWLFEKLGE